MEVGIGTHLHMHTQIGLGFIITGSARNFYYSILMYGRTGLGLLGTCVSIPHSISTSFRLYEFTRAFTPGFNIVIYLHFLILCWGGGSQLIFTQPHK